MSTTANIKPPSQQLETWRFPRTDAGNADLFAALYGRQLRFDHSTGKWYVWCGHWWELDDREQVFRLALRVVRLRRTNSAALDRTRAAEEFRWAYQSESRMHLASLLDLAKSIPEISTVDSKWDRDPMLLAVGNGVIDLRTGHFHAGTPDQMIRTRTNILFDSAACCPRFVQFFEEIFPGDSELQVFVRRAIGYTLTGLTGEQIGFMLCGEGSNGKTTLLRVMQELLGDYAFDLPFLTFDAKHRSSIPNDLFKVRGRRLITSSETQGALVLNEARFKQLTGEDMISARPLYGEFVNFRSYAKLWMAFNNFPQINDSSHGMWRRVRVIPFRRQFPVDPQLFPILRQELPGVLNWFIEACLEYQRYGVPRSASVAEFTESCRIEADVVSQFVREWCEVDPNGRETAQSIANAYADWAILNRTPSLSKQELSRRLKQLGFSSERFGHDRNRGYAGIRLRTELERLDDECEPCQPVDLRTIEDKLSNLNRDNEQ